MARNRDPRKGFLARWFHRLRWLRRAMLIAGAGGAVAKALRGRAGGGSGGGAAGGARSSGRPAPTGGPGGPRPAASAAAPSASTDRPTGASASSSPRTLVSVPPLDHRRADDDVAGDGDSTPDEIRDVDGAEQVDEAEQDDAGSRPPTLTVVGGADRQAPTGDDPWVVPLEGGDCPPGYPIKANDNSGIYHVPGGRSYNRTVPERCYATEEAAQADGYRPAKA